MASSDVSAGQGEPSSPHYKGLPAECEFRPPCPGCPRYGDEKPPPDALKALEALRTLCPAPPLEIVGFPGLSYRHRVRLSVRKVGARIRLGIFEEGTHRLVPIARCPLHHPALIDVAQAIETELQDKRVSAHDEERHVGLVRAVQLVVAREGSGRDSGLVQVTIVVRDETALLPRPGSPFESVLLALAARSDVQAIFLNAQPGRTNTLLGPRFELFRGAPFLEQACAGAANYFPPGAFGQSNPALHAQVVEKIASFVPDGSRVVEFHAGVGSIGLAIASRRNKIASLHMNEVNPAGLVGLAQGILSLGSPKEIHVASGPARDHASLLGEAEVVIVDPPRKGLEPELIEALLRARPLRLIYLSCGLESLIREAHSFISNGLLPTWLGAYSYFPFTWHVESLVVFDRS